MARSTSVLSDIRRKAAQGLFEFSEQAVEQSIIRQISVQEVREAFGNAQIIEDYPDDRYGPSCLLFGFTMKRRPLHIHCSYPSRPVMKLVTLYEPDPAQWRDFEVRRVLR